jgi:hypothetical protein
MAHLKAYMVKLAVSKKKKNYSNVPKELCKK